jgi:hypothetical protein
MQIKHVCPSCGELLVVHEHSSWQEIKDCDVGRRALCDACRSWLGCPLPKDGPRGQEVNR